MVLEELAAILIGAIIGSMASFSFFYNWEMKKRRDEIEKIKGLLNSDLVRVYDLAKEDLKNIQKLKPSLDEIVENLYSRKYTVEQYFAGKHLSFDFNFWSAITTSGSLIKLKENEIEDVQILVDEIQRLDEENEKREKQFSVNTQQGINVISKNGQKKEIIKRNLIEISADQERVCTLIIKLLDTSELPWLKLRE